MNHKQRCEEQEISSIRTSNGSDPCWKKHFHKKTLNFRINADFKADDEIDTYSIDGETTEIMKQNPACNG